MSLSDFTPYITVAAPVVGIIAALDYVVRKEIKAHVADRMLSLARIGVHTISLESYGLTVLTSFVFTLIIILVSGCLQTLREAHGSMILAIESTGPMLVAIFLKVTLADYLLAFKSSSLWHFYRNVKIKTPHSRVLRGTVCSALFLADLLVSAVITATVINWFDLAQVKSANGSSFGEALTNLFKHIDLMLKASIQKSFYILNGSLIFYLSFGLSALGRGLSRFGDIDLIRTNIFKLIATLVLAVISVVLICFRLFA